MYRLPEADRSRIASGLDPTSPIQRGDTRMSTQDLGSQEVTALGAPASGYQLAKCTFKKNGVFAGYLASSTNAYVWLTDDPGQAAHVKWKIDGDGRWWLEKDTAPNDRFLGV